MASDHQATLRIATIACRRPGITYCTPPCAITVRVWSVIGCMTWLMNTVGQAASAMPAPIASTNRCVTWAPPSSSQGTPWMTPTTPIDGSAAIARIALVKIVGSMIAAPVTSSGFCTVP